MPKQTKHTPGPWTLTEDDFVYIITGPNGQHLAEVERKFTNDIVIGEGDISAEEGLANAQIMNAAPELLDALKACHLQMLQSNNQSGYAQEANQLAIAAIAKAEGGAA